MKEKGIARGIVREMKKKRERDSEGNREGY